MSDQPIEITADATVTGHYAMGVGGDQALVFITYESPNAPEQQSGGSEVQTSILTSCVLMVCSFIVHR